MHIRPFFLFGLLSVFASQAFAYDGPVIDMHLHAWPSGEDGGPERPRNQQAMARTLAAENADPGSLRFSQIQYFIGYIDVFANRPSHAIKAFEASLRARPGAGHAMMMAAIMAGNEFHDEALYLSGLALAQLEMTEQVDLTSERVRESDIRDFRATVEADKAAALASGRSD